MDYEGLYKSLTDQAKVIGSSGKGWGKFAGTNRKAATAITDLLARAEAAEARAEKAERERDEAVETIFKWTGCAECKNWQSDTDWCEKHDRYATISDGCSTPEWRGIKEE